ncbi:MAG: hypothetical protein JW946_03950 [Candidatus Omnitrophica bacterium]|nr:hypothetical protein [Candidatus Omnitrophota bacterium]
MRKIFTIIIFFIGWILSPLTLWNDAFINIPLSYLITNLIRYIAPAHFGLLFIASYWFTNIIGLLFMYVSGRYFILSHKQRRKSVFMLLIMLLVVTAAIACLDKNNKLYPINEYFAKIK